MTNGIRQDLGMQNIRKAVFLCLALTVAIGFSFIQSASAQGVVREIRVDGSERVEPATVMSYMDLKVGDPMTREALDASLKSLFATGLFADVTLSQEGDTVVVSVIENPVINEIAFEGNDKIKDDELLAEIQLRPRQVFTRTKVQSDVSRLYQVYRQNGRFSVNIEPKVIRLDQNRVNLVFEIEETGVTTIKTISFVGNERFDDDRLRSEISTKETAWYRFLTSDDRYDPDRLAYDQEQLRRFYLSQGYADFRILSAVAELSKERENFFITFTLEEGERYKVGKVGVDSRLRNFDANVLNDQITFKQGDWYDADRVQEVVDGMTSELGDLQYAFVTVRPDIHRNRESKTVDISFQINETPRVFVERVNVTGNVRTQDKVLRREMLLVEGDPFNKSKLARSEQNIRDLDYFESVNVEAKPGSAPDKTVVDIDVAEKSTGELSVGAGFSTSDGPLADFRIRERNLLGKGQDLLFSTTIAGKRTEFDVSFTEPHFLDRDLSAGVDIFHITRDLQDESSFDQRRTGGGLRFGYPLSERWRQNWKYRLENNEITDVQSDASRFIRDQEGQRVTSAVGQRVEYDSRDSQMFPTEGLLGWLDTEVAGLGGDAQYVSAKTGASYFYPLADRVVVNALGEIGAIEGYGDSDVEINERYFIGGSSLRGFAKAGIGPRDATTDDALGGNVFYRGSLETSFPIGLPEEMGILGHGFTDFGSLWDIDETGADILDESSIRASAGLGLSWRSPFGPIRADVALPYLKEDFDEKEVFRFNFGTRF
ncbi:MAG: outer membrane protein assembly factor BamA [Alphaproteobacteria bacterium]|nr:outer membrane protein assembly factor BamA [Alphaproteobacteria bacterium]